MLDFGIPRDARPWVWLLTILSSAVACDNAVEPDPPDPAGAPAALYYVAGGTPSGPVGTLLPEPLVIRVDDAGGDPVEGVEVRWSVRGERGSISPEVDTTDADGRSAARWTLGTRAGVDSAQAKVARLHAAVVTAPVEPGPLARVRTDPEALALWVGAERRLEARAEDEYGNPLDVQTFTWFSSDPGVATVHGTGSVTGVSEGAAVITATLDEQIAEAEVHVLASGARPISSLGAGFNHACALSTEGEAFCWGNQTGNGHNTPTNTPVPVAGGHRFTEISAGYVFTCALTDAGQVYCWGRGRFGQLGNGRKEQHLTPVPTASDSSFVAVSAGFAHACALTAGGHAYCWGLDYTDQLGSQAVDEECTHYIGPDQAVSCSTTPVPVSTDLRFTSIGTGLNHTCATSREGELYCWGEVPLGGHVDRNEEPVKYPTPVPVAAVNANNPTCALASGGELYCMGRLPGDGSEVGETPTLVSSGLRFSQMSGDHTFTCGVTTEHTAYCWGNNHRGKLGNGTTNTDELEPHAIVGDHSFVQVGAGSSYACAIDDDTNTYCWGGNTFGQLGNGTNSDSTEPVPIVWRE